MKPYGGQRNYDFVEKFYRNGCGKRSSTQRKDSKILHRAERRKFRIEIKNFL